jgi:hypothetical protein
MYQRWYDPKSGTFGSMAPYKSLYEKQYSFANNRPSMLVDSRGMSQVADDGSAILDQAIAKCKDTPCRTGNDTNGGDNIGDSCYSFVCCVMEEMSYPGKGGSFSDPQPMPIGPPAVGITPGPGDIVCYGEPASGCTPSNICGQAHGESIGATPTHVGIIDSTGSFHECGDGLQSSPGGPPPCVRGDCGSGRPPISGTW